MLPLRGVSGTTHLLNAQRRPIEVPGADIHHRNETLQRPSDPWLLAHAARGAGPFMLSLRAGVTLPLGRTEEDPFELGRRRAAGLPVGRLDRLDARAPVASNA